ncbi:MAG: hypothetical protein P1S60_00095 [Anaerolineae bacterium]|nr:hypothetical protein [Anaerolineae bacterium]
MRRNFYRLIAPLLGAALWLGIWTVTVKADGGSGIPLPDGAVAAPCSDWTQVNIGAFGVPSTGTVHTNGNYYFEDLFEVAVFNGQLYVGMEADDAYGAQIWRSKAGVSTVVTQTDWEEVAQLNNLPFGNGTFAEDSGGAFKLQNDHIDSLAGFDGVLYASTANGSDTEQGHLIYSSTTGAPGTWTPVIEPGFGYTQNVNFKDMQVYDGWLCGGTQNATTGAQVWCTQDGNQWLQKSRGGFGTTSAVPDVIEVWSGHVYSGALYFGAQRQTMTPGVFEGVLYKTTDISAGDPSWTAVYTSPPGGYRIDILGDLDDALYISHYDTENGIVILRSQVGDNGTWVPVNTAGMDNSPENVGTVVDGATVYNGMLYCAVQNTTSGVQIWRTDGISRSGGLHWTSAAPPGFGQSHNQAAELVSWNGYLYAWVGNYVTGQEVRRTSCAICQAQSIDGTGRYEYTAVGTVLTFTIEAVDVVTVCVQPDLLPVYPLRGIVLSRTIEISTSPPAASFLADVAVTYDRQELSPSAVNSTTLYLRYWAGDAWVTSCAGDHNAATATIICHGLTQFPVWAIFGTPGAALSVQLTQLNVGFSLVGLAIICLIGSGLWVWVRRDL